MMGTAALRFITALQQERPDGIEVHEYDHDTTDDRKHNHRVELARQHQMRRETAAQWKLPVPALGQPNRQGEPQHTRRWIRARG